MVITVFVISRMLVNYQCMFSAALVLLRSDAYRHGVMSIRGQGLLGVGGVKNAFCHGFPVEMRLLVLPG